MTQTLFRYKIITAGPPLEHVPTSFSLTDLAFIPHSNKMREQTWLDHVIHDTYAARLWCESDETHTLNICGAATAISLCCQINAASSCQQHAQWNKSRLFLSAWWQICTAYLTLNPRTFDSNVEACNKIWNTVVILCVGAPLLDQSLVFTNFWDEYILVKLLNVACC